MTIDNTLIWYNNNVKDIRNEVRKMTHSEILDNIVDELERARKRIRELGEFNDEVLTEDEELVSDIDKSLERVSELYDLTS